MESIKPDNWENDNLSKFLENLQKNTYHVFIQLKKEYEIIRQVNATFEEARDLMHKMDTVENAFPVFFIMMAHNAFLAGVRLAFGGQLPPCYAVLRTCLENSLVGFYLKKNPGSIKTWLKRHENSELKEKVRNEFAPWKLIDFYKMEDSINGGVTRNLYDFSIDNGGHPNEWALISNLDTKKMREGTLGYDYVVNLERNPIPYHTCLKKIAETGICSLLISKAIYPERFEIMGLDEKVETLKNSYRSYFPKDIGEES